MRLAVSPRIADCSADESDWIAEHSVRCHCVYSALKRQTGQSEPARSLAEPKAFRTVSK